MTTPPALPSPSRERWPLAIAALTVLTGVVLVVVAVAQLRGAHGQELPAPPQAPPVVVVRPAAAVVRAPAPAVAAAPAPSDVQRITDEQRFARNDHVHVRASWVAGFYPIYAEAQRTFGVNWLLIASVHKQETAFSTHPTTYHGRNFAGCCAGPMQFNVTNGPVTTWDRYRSAGARAQRPASYPHPTRRHPSVYDDYDSIMAAAALLHDSGAGTQLDASAWRAAYDYYGHDLTGIDYANEVLARAIGWGQHGFCINCSTDAGILQSVDAAWGAPVRAEMTAQAQRGAANQRAAAGRSAGRRADQRRAAAQRRAETRRRAAEQRRAAAQRSAARRAERRRAAERRAAVRRRTARHATERRAGTPAQSGQQPRPQSTVTPHDAAGAVDDQAAAAAG